MKTNVVTEHDAELTAKFSSMGFVTASPRMALCCGNPFAPPG